MSRLRIFLSRVIESLGGWLGGNKRDDDLRAEIDAHIDEATAEFTRQGMSHADARHAALRKFGGVTQIIEAHRAQRRFTFFSTLGQDLRYAVRTLVRTPGFAIITVLTLAIGILGTTTIFSGVNALLFTPLPAEQPEQIAEVLAGDRRAPSRFGKHVYAHYMAMRDNNSLFTALAAIKDTTVPISNTAQAAKAAQHSGVLRGEVVSGNYFEMLGIRAAHGRVFTPDDDRTPNGHPFVVISDRVWRTRLNADQQAIGRVMYLNGNPFTVIGILPATFTGTVFATETDFWAPLMMQGQLGGDPNWWRPEAAKRGAIVTMCWGPNEKTDCAPPRQFGDLRVLGRLRTDVSADVASA